MQKLHLYPRRRPPPIFSGGKALLPAVEQIGGVVDTQFLSDKGSWLPAVYPVVDSFAFEVLIEFAAWFVHGLGGSLFGQSPVRQFEATSEEFVGEVWDCDLYAEEK